MNDRSEPSCVVISAGREELTLRAADPSDRSERNKTRGFHLTRSKWDPYPWVGSVQKDSIADISGLRAGDCLLKVDGADLLGVRMQDIATLIGRTNQVNLQIWRRPQDDFFASGEEETCDKENAVYECPAGSTIANKSDTAVALQGPLPEVAHKLASTISGVVKALECPVCLESSAPPVSQCVHGHILCVGCRPKTERCPVCRVRLGQGRCLLADKLHQVLQENFSISLSDPSSSDQVNSLYERLFGSKKNKEKDRSRFSLSKPKHLLSNLLPLMRNYVRATSTESLPDVSVNSHPSGRDLLKQAFGQHLDRTKSASTGELTGDDRNEMNISARCGSLLSVPLTPNWGGSTESMSDFRFVCPLSRGDCTEKTSPATILQHLISSHKGPLIHFYTGKIQVPYPLPFGEDAVYILHCFEDLFFLQKENLNFWISGLVLSGKKWQWSIRGIGNSESVKFVQEVINLQESTAPKDYVITPPELYYSKIEVSLFDIKLGEGVDI